MQHRCIPLVKTQRMHAGICTFDKQPAANPPRTAGYVYVRIGGTCAQHTPATQAGTCQLHRHSVPAIYSVPSCVYASSVHKSLPLCCLPDAMQARATTRELHYTRNRTIPYHFSAQSLPASYCELSHREHIHTSPHTQQVGSVTRLPHLPASCP